MERSQVIDSIRQLAARVLPKGSTLYLYGSRARGDWREEIKDLLCYLRLSVNPNDEEALRRIINKPARGIGDTTVKKLLAAAATAGTSVWEVLKASSIPSQGRENGRGSSPSPWGRAGERLALFYEMIASFHESSATDDAYTLAMRIAIESGLRDYIFSGHDPEDISRQENLQEMLDGIAAFVQDNQEQGRGMLLADYLQEASLATDLDRRGQGEDDDSVNMMTIHTAKGLEFPVVFIAGLEEGLFPSEMSEESPRAIEEERRLFYVALTRAERQVIITYAKQRFRFGKMEFMRPSRFLREIPQQYFRQQTTQQTTDNRQQSFAERPRIDQRVIRRSSVLADLQSARNNYGHVPSEGQRITNPYIQNGRIANPAEQRNPNPTGQSSLSVGTVVLHERFGRGVVQAIEGTGIDAKATVAFDNAGTKVLMLRFAKLTLQ